MRRDQLADPVAFARTLLHEAAHARSGAQDESFEFEDALTDIAGDAATGR
ncbi:hypothetical protein [Motilibacter rhizosphaerae]|nr:hypothetical protein [Motilibacter rhizosphaerae]